jgi:SAM-dependent methyltransferase
MRHYLCPDCREEIDPVGLRCLSGHRFEEQEGVLVLLSQEFRPRLEAFLETLRDYRSRQGKRLLDESAYDRLPGGEAERGNPDWLLRCHDLGILRPLLSSRPPGRLLDVGSFNGWLAHHLSGEGHRVTAVDYFSDPYDGLGARRFYAQARWRSIQMDLLDLTILNRTYDVVVLNRCLQFFPDPVRYLEQAMRTVAPGGMLVATGLDLFRNPRRKREAWVTLAASYRDRYGSDFFLHPTRGYLDFGDRRRLRDLGVEIRPYPQLRRANLVSRVLSSRARCCFGIWRSPAPS